MSYRVVVVSDIHIGSIYGPLPPDFKTSEDAHKPQNPGQRYLWRCWVDFCGWVRQFENVIAVVVNGEPIDGQQRIQWGTELSLPILLDQEEASIQLLNLLKTSLPKAEWRFVQGTEYHDGRAGHSVERVAERLGAVPYYGLGTGRYSREVMDYDIDGVILNFYHHISSTSGFYRATPADREGIWSALAGKAGKVPKADCFIRSHVHYFYHVEHASKHGIVTPAWQLQTRFMRKAAKSAYRMMPDIGGIVIEIDPAAKRAGEDPIVAVKKQLYALPPFITTKATLPGDNEQTDPA